MKTCRALGLLFAACAGGLAHAQTTFIFNANYPLIPSDPAPRTFLWSDARNWGGNLPGTVDTAVLAQYSELTGAFTVGSARLTDASINGTGGSLEVLNNFRADGAVTFFNALILRGQSQFGLSDSANSTALFYRPVDNYGDLVIYSTSYSPFTPAGGTQSTLTNHTGATLTFGAAANTSVNLGGTSGFVNQSGATINKTGAGETILTAALLQLDGTLRPAFDHHGQLNIQGGKLTLKDGTAGNWEGGRVTLSNNATLAFHFGLPRGTVALDGNGVLSALGGEMAGALTLNFAANSAIQIKGFHPYDINHDLTLNGPVTLRETYFTGTTGRLILRDAITFALPAANGFASDAYLFLNVRNEGTTTIAGGGAGASISGSGSYFWSNLAGSTLNLTGAAALSGAMVLDNQPGATLRYTANPAQPAASGRIDWHIDNQGRIEIASGTLGLANPRHWNGGTVALASGARLDLLGLVPDGTITFTGSGSVGASGNANIGAVAQGPTTLVFDRAASQIVLSGFEVAATAPFTFDGPMRFESGALRGSALFTFLNRYPGASFRPVTIGGATPTALALSADVRNETHLDIINARITASNNQTFTNAHRTDDANPLQPALLRLSGDVHLTGEMRLVNGEQGIGTPRPFITKTGGGTAEIEWTFDNRGYVSIESGNAMNIRAPGNWDTGSATVAAGATLRFFANGPTGFFNIYGQGSVQLGDYTLTSISSQIPLRLPWSSTSDSITLIDSTIRATGVNWEITAPQTFLRNTLSTTGGVTTRLLANTTWNRTNTTDTNFLNGSFVNTATATVNGYGLVANAGTTTWTNANGSTLRLTEGRRYNSEDPLPRTAGLLGNQGVFINQPGALVWRDGTTTNGVAAIDWLFYNQGTVRIQPETGLDFTNAGNWHGSTLELNGGFIRFTNYAPTGTVTVFSGGSDTIFHNAYVGAAGFTYHFADTAAVYPRTIMSDFHGLGRIVLSGRNISLQHDDSTLNFINSNYGPFRWANIGGVELRGDIALDPNFGLPAASRELDLQTTLDIAGRFRVAGTEIHASSGDITVRAGGRLVLDNAHIDPFRPNAAPDAAPANARLVVETGGILQTFSRNITNPTVSELRLPVDLRGTLVAGAYQNITFSNSGSAMDWTGGRVEFDPSGTAKLRFFGASSAPLGSPTFSGPGHVIFNGGGIDVSNRTYVFQSFPTLSLTEASLTGPNAYLRLEGNAELSSTIHLPSLGTEKTGQRLELAGSFVLKPENTTARTYFYGLPQVVNSGQVFATGIEAPYLLWTNQTGSTFQIGNSALRDTTGFDQLLAARPSPEAPAISSHFDNRTGADFTAVGPTRVNWQFTNAGRVQLLGAGTNLIFAGAFTNPAGGLVDLGVGTTATFDGVFPKEAPLFRGGGTVNLNGTSSTNRLGVDNAVLTFATTTTGSPTLNAQNLHFTTTGTALRLAGTASLAPGALTIASSPGGNNHVALAGNFRLADIFLTPFSLNLAEVRNTGQVATGGATSGTSPGGFVSVALPLPAVTTSVPGFIWRNQSGSSFALNDSTDLTHPFAQTSTSVPTFYNEAGATFTTNAVTNPAYAGYVTNVSWNFVNRGLIDVQSGSLVFQGTSLQGLGGTYRVAPGASIDFGPNSLIEMQASFTVSGHFIAGRFNVANPTTLATDSPLRLSGGGLTLQPGSSLSVGVQRLELGAPVIGSGSLTAGTVAFVGASPLISASGTQLVVNGNVQFADGTPVSLGTGSTLTVQGGSLTGTGSIQAGQVIIGGQSTSTTAGGTLHLTANNVLVQSGSTANFGTSDVTLVGPFSGQGTVQARTLIWNVGTYISSGPSTLAFNARLHVDSGASVVFGPTSSITFAGGLGGSGIFSAGTLSVVGGVVSPGSSPGTLALVGNTTFSSATVFNFELGRLAQDLITVNGNLTLAGTFNLTPLYDLVTGSYPLFTYTGSLTNLGLTLGTLGPGITSAAFYTDLSNRVVGVNLIAVSAIPEPSTYAALLGLGVLAFAFARRRATARTDRTTH
jgi:hypothetical protein